MECSQLTASSSFTLQGRLRRLYGKHRKRPKAIQIKTKYGRIYIQIPKKLRKRGFPKLKKGEWVWVTGALKPKGRRCILKAAEIRSMIPEVSPEVSSTPNNGKLVPEPCTSSSQSGKVLICLKSDCVKRGAKVVEKAIETLICDRNLTEEITIKPTGCMGHCKKGPNVVVFPGKQRYQNVKPSDAPKLITPEPSCRKNIQY